MKLDFSKESDYDINVRCAKLLKEDINYFSPTWEPESALKIQLNNKIGLVWDECDSIWIAFSNYRPEDAGWSFESEPKFYEPDENPLRAICIVFLMINEINNEIKSD